MESGQDRQLRNTNGSGQGRKNTRKDESESLPGSAVCIPFIASCFCTDTIYPKTFP